MASLERGYDAVIRANVGRQALEMTGATYGPLFFGPFRPAEARERSLAVMARMGLADSPLVQSHDTALNAVACALEGDFDRARSLADQVLAILEEFGQMVLLAGARGSILPFVWLASGDLETAEREQRMGCEALLAMGETGYLSTSAGMLADTLETMDRLEEVDRWVTICRENSAEDDFSSQILWRGVQALLLSRSGEADEAERLAREAVRIAEPTDYLVERGDAHVRLAKVLHRIGKPRDAEKEVATARALYEQKGAPALVARLEEQWSALPG